MQEFSDAELQATFLMLIIMFFVSMALFIITSKIFNYLILKFKIAKIKRLAKKIDLKGYVLKTNQKGIPVLIVSKNNPDDIFLI